jgi:hypothetical protein
MVKRSVPEPVGPVLTPNTPGPISTYKPKVQGPSYRPLTQKRQYATKVEWEQNSGAGGTYGRPATKRTTVTTTNAKTGKVINKKTSKAVLTYANTYRTPSRVRAR